MTDDVLTVAEVAARIDVAPATLHRAVNRGDEETKRMGAARIGSRVLFRRPIFERWLNGEPEPKQATLIAHKRIRPIRGEKVS